MIMNPNEFKFILEQLPFSANFPADVLEQLSQTSQLVHVVSGDVLFREGGSNDRLFLVRQGCLALEMNVPVRGTSRILTLGPGEMCGWSALLGDGKMTASAIAIQNSELVAMAASHLSDLSASNPAFGFHVMRQLASALSTRLVATRLQLLDLFGDAR